MTKDLLTPGTTTYTISGTGPYLVDCGYGAPADFMVTVTDALGVETVIALGDDCTISPDSDDAGGDLTLTTEMAEAANGLTLTIMRSTQVEQGWAGASAREIGLEVQMDRIVMASQEAQRDIARAPRMPVSYSGAQPVLPVPEEGQVLVWGAVEKC